MQAKCQKLKFQHFQKDLFMYFYFNQNSIPGTGTSFYIFKDFADETMPDFMLYRHHDTHLTQVPGIAKFEAEFKNNVMGFNSTFLETQNFLHNKSV